MCSATWGCRLLVLDAENGRHQRTACVNNVCIDRSVYTFNNSIAAVKRRGASKAAVLLYVSLINEQTAVMTDVQIEVWFRKG